MYVLKVAAEFTNTDFTGLDTVCCSLPVNHCGLANIASRSPLGRLRLSDSFVRSYHNCKFLVPWRQNRRWDHILPKVYVKHITENLVTLL